MNLNYLLKYSKSKDNQSTLSFYPLIRAFQTSRMSPIPIQLQNQILIYSQELYSLYKAQLYECNINKKKFSCYLRIRFELKGLPFPQEIVFFKRGNLFVH